MKKNMALFLMLFFATVSYAQHDTTTIAWGKGKILIISEKEDTVASLKKNYSETTTSKKKEKKFNGSWSGLEFGVNGYLSSSGSFTLHDKWNYIDLYQPKSASFNLNLMEKSITLLQKRVGIVTGLGFGWNNYRFNRKIVLLSQLDTLSFTYDSLVKKSKLVVTSLRIPLLLEWHIPINQSKDILYISGGVIGALRAGTYTKYQYLSDGEVKNVKEKSDFHINPFYYSFEFRLGIEGIGIYFNYHPISLFKRNKGPEVYPWSAGVSLVF